MLGKLFNFKLRKKEPNKVLRENDIRGIIQQELLVYMTQADVKEYLNKIHKDEHKRKVWESLSPSKKLRLLRYVSERRVNEKRK